MEYGATPQELKRIEDRVERQLIEAGIEYDKNEVHRLCEHYYVWCEPTKEDVRFCIEDDNFSFVKIYTEDKGTDFSDERKIRIGRNIFFYNASNLEMTDEILERLKEEEDGAWENGVTLSMMMGELVWW